jgi:hypothetical protein
MQKSRYEVGEMPRELTTCSRCKQEHSMCGSLQFVTDSSDTTIMLCDVCLPAARMLWANFMGVAKKEQDLPTLTDNSIMEFGKHKGKKLKNVPAPYLIWVGDQTWITQKPRLHRYIEKNRAALEEEIAENG